MEKPWKPEIPDGAPERANPTAALTSVFKHLTTTAAITCEVSMTQLPAVVPSAVPAVLPAQPAASAPASSPVPPSPVPPPASQVPMPMSLSSSYITPIDARSAARTRLEDQQLGDFDDSKFQGAGWTTQMPMKPAIYGCQQSQANDMNVSYRPNLWNRADSWFALNEMEKTVAAMQQRISELAESFTATKNDIDEIRGTCINLESVNLESERRLEAVKRDVVGFERELTKVKYEGIRELQRARERAEDLQNCLNGSMLTQTQMMAAARERDQLQVELPNQLATMTENVNQLQMKIVDLQNVIPLRQNQGEKGKPSEN